VIQDSSDVTIGAADAILDTSNAGFLQAAGYKRYDALGGYAVVLFRNVSGGSTHSLSSGGANSWFAIEKR